METEDASSTNIRGFFITFAIRFIFFLLQLPTNLMPLTVHSTCAATRDRRREGGAYFQGEIHSWN